MRLPPLFPGTFLRRWQRFFVAARLASGEEVVAHCANPGSMRGCLPPLVPVLLSRSENPARKLAFTLELVRVGRTWVGVNTLRTNRVVEEALHGGHIPELAGHGSIHPEAPIGGKRRADFLLTGGERPCWVEVKNVTLADGRLARFPDSVTTRGAAHLDELAKRARAGDRAVMLYVVNRGDCDRAAPARSIDPAYGRHLDAALAAGVEAIAFRARVTRREITLANRIPFLP
ncbi:MAG: DNA/RNA nuclease SfsA [Planctomycetes bacterium]|jgi:sugar fermentation stimulation protein A|nr:DNA/RNA nuclease SfsA [Planctomycetota bacterium]